MMLLLVAVGAAWAHYPHDAALYVAIAPGPDPAWVITSVWRTEAWMIARTANDADVDVRYLMVGEGEFIGAGAMLGDARLVLGTEGRGLWVSDDAGDTFSAHPDLPADATVNQVLASPAVEDDGIGIAVGPGGIWRTADAGDRWTLVEDLPDVDLIDADLSPAFATDGRACALAADGDVRCSSDAGATWSLVGSNGGRPWKVSLDTGDRLWVGDELGLWRSDDGGTSFDLVGFEGQDVPVVEALGDGLVLAATLKEAVWRSEDGGDTWELHADYLEIPQDGQGGPRKEEHYFEFEEAGDGALYLAAWEGINRSDDRGLTWQRVHTEHQAVVRDVELTRGESGRIEALLATYGGGVCLVDALEPTGRSISTQAAVRFLRNVAGTPDWGADGVAMFAGAGKVYVTTDFAQTWFQGGAGELNNIQKSALSRNYGEAPLMQVAGSATGTIDLATSTDGGVTWEHGEAPRCGGAGSALFHSWAWEDDGAAWAACQGDGSVLESRDRGQTWALLGLAGSTVLSVVGAPEGARVFAAATDGLYAYEPGGSLERVAFEGQQVQGLAISPDWSADPAVFAVLAGGGWWRSDDGGDTWTELLRPDEQYPLAVAVSPDFALDGIVAVSGYGGAWVSADRGETWRWANVVERHENDSPQWVFEGDWEISESPAASGGRLHGSATAGDHAWFVFEGLRLDLMAPTSSGAGTLRVSLDDGAPEDVSLDSAATDGAIVWQSGEIPDGWHRLDVEVVSGTVAVDAAQVWRQLASEGHDTADPDTADPDTADPDTAEPDTGDAVTGDAVTGPPKTRCGCGGGGAAGLLLLPLMAVSRRRRQGAPKGQLSKGP